MDRNIQDLILDKLESSHNVATVFTTNGYQMRGRVSAYDHTVIVLADGNKQMCIYKSAISTIVPDTPVEL